MTQPPFSHQERAATAIAYAGHLRSDLARLAGMLEHYRTPAFRLEELRETGSRCTRQLEAISGRLNALGGGSDPGKYALSDQEHAALDAALSLRTRMMDTLSDMQAAEHAGLKPRT